MSHEIERADSANQTARGLGRTSSGPAFAPPAAGLPVQDRPLTEQPPTAPQPSLAQPSRLRRLAPAVGTAVILAVAVMIIVAGTISGQREAAEDAARSTPAPAVSAPPDNATDPTAGESDAIEFITDTGRGQLRVVDHTWLRRPNAATVRLRVLIEIRSLDGAIDYDPAYFFAAQELANPVRAEDSFAHGDLDIGVLQPGEAARGYLTFQVPRGDVTLMMSSDTADWVTAIKIAN